MRSSSVYPIATRLSEMMVRMQSGKCSYILDAVLLGKSYCRLGPTGEDQCRYIPEREHYAVSSCEERKGYRLQCMIQPLVK